MPTASARTRCLPRARVLYPAAALCHRLDAGTGGVALLALTEGARAHLTDAFKNHLIGKTYRCLVVGCPEKPEGELIPLPQKGRGRRARPGNRPKTAPARCAPRSNTA